MKISKSYYNIWGKDWVYYVEAKSSLIAYIITSIVDGVTTIIEQDTLDASATKTITFTEEGQYQITVVYPANGGTDRTAYDVRCYPDTKADIISSMRDVICNCPALGVDFSNCSNSPLSPVEQDIHLMQQIYNSVGLYDTLLMSPSFLRAHSCCFMGTLQENYYKLETLIKDLYSKISLNGYTPNSYYLMRLYTAYRYVMLYVMEMDMASCIVEGTAIVTPPAPPDAPPTAGSDCEDEILAVQELFDIPAAKLCFNTLGLDFVEIYNSFYLCYMENSVGICTVTSVAPLPPEFGAVDNLTYTNYNLYVEIGETILPTQFTWDVEGTPVALVLDDGGYGQIEDVSVTGNSHDTSASYMFAVKGSVEWTLSGDNVASITLQTNWMYPAYYGKKLTDAFPDATEITTTGTKVVGDFSTEITVPIGTGVTEYGWIAVAVDESIQYTNWKVLNSALNGSVIGVVVDSEQFIELNPAGTVTISGNEYRVYMYTYPSEVTDPLKLYKLNTGTVGGAG